MDPKASFVFYLLGLICFLVAAFWDTYLPAANTPRPAWRNVNLIALGLAFVDFVWMYTAWKAI